MIKKFVLIILLLAFPLSGAAQAGLLPDVVVGSLIKTVAKTYISTVNMDKFKEKNIKKLNKMDEEKFQRIYGEIYMGVMVELPTNVRETYSITEDMTRAKAIELLKAMDKKKFKKLINSVPSRLVAREFREYKQLQKKSGKELDDKMWDVLEHKTASVTPVQMSSAE